MFKKLLIISFILTLAGCSNSINYDKIDHRKGLAPQSPALITASEKAGTSATSPVLIRIFKQSNELELWRKNSNGNYVLVNVFTICAFSGDLGPKEKQGDRQAPEGFYNIVSSQLNYHSIRFLSLNTGFPNIYDRSNGATGSALMIHGGCDSSGCYAIQDAPMQDLFAAVRDALRAGQKSVQLQIYPFRMTAINMLIARNSKHIDFWQQLKVGYDKFELTNNELNISVIKKQYIVK
jgi:murein L,D-transpeptidase YafK